MTNIIISLFLSSAPAAGLDRCTSSGVLDKLSIASGEILKQANIDYVKSNTADFCRRNMLLRFLKNLKPPEIVDDNWPLDKLEAAADKRNTETYPWQMTLVSTKNARQRAVDSILLGEKAGAAFEKVDPPDPERYNKIKNWFETKMSTTERIKSIGSSAELIGLCAIEMTASIPSCNRALNIIKTNLAPKGGEMEVTESGMWQRVAESNQYDEGLRRAALRLSDRVGGDYRANSNVFDDVKGSFLDSGMNSTAANQAAWDTMGVIGNQASNIGAYMQGIEMGGWGYQEGVNFFV